ncbi:zinc ribbon-containing protein [Larsenimonas rhizosphaerae]|uniref:Zinc ribbon-containing protein n=1 Tax=Larsenimonas rhizosphaerae TaxID=2944682 RepID=A0AA42CUB9_9GAMM|nr:zinc ribbon-containing protein [Larsenimonas rhizosphaerae]MCM2131161.1 zinc ribbon-containing protein [Larsenimonas rhizosphaerae]MCX2523866.1 zinc ribbon-containing protein [Larsenimonas rhizosphaerae]
MNNQPDRQQRLKDAYERSMSRFGEREQQREDTSRWSKEGLARELDEIIAFEADVEEFTRDELSLLRAWLERDVRQFGHFMAEGGGGLAQWMGIDLDYLSNRLRQALFSMADRTAIDQYRFNDDLEAAQADYCEGELALPGRMRCVHCDQTVTFTTSSLLEACHGCGHRYFKRDSIRVG